MNLDVRGSSSTGSGGRLCEVSAGPHSAANFYGYGEWRLESGDQPPTVTMARLLCKCGIFPTFNTFTICSTKHPLNLT